MVSCAFVGGFVYHFSEWTRQAIKSARKDTKLNGMERQPLRLAVASHLPLHRAGKRVG